MPSEEWGSRCNALTTIMTKVESPVTAFDGPNRAIRPLSLSCSRAEMHMYHIPRSHTARERQGAEMSVAGSSMVLEPRNASHPAETSFPRGINHSHARSRHVQWVPNERAAKKYVAIG